MTHELEEWTPIRIVAYDIQLALYDRITGSKELLAPNSALSEQFLEVGTGTCFQNLFLDDAATTRRRTSGAMKAIWPRGKRSHLTTGFRLAASIWASQQRHKSPDCAADSCTNYGLLSHPSLAKNSTILKYSTMCAAPYSWYGA